MMVNIWVPEYIGEYAHRRNTTVERLVDRWIRAAAPPAIAERGVCCECGELFILAKNKRLYCSEECYRSAPFPRKGIRWQDVQECYGQSVVDAADALGVSRVQFSRFVQKHGLHDRFLSRAA